jgi:hypothetical protein
VSETVDKTVKTHVDNHMDKTKENIKRLEERMKDYQTQLRREPFFLYDTGVEGSFQSLDDVKVKVDEF